MPRSWMILPATLVFSLGSSVQADDWPQWLGPRRDGIWRETGIIDKFPASGPKVLWRSPIGAGYAGPAVAGGRVFITDRVLNEGARNDPNPFSKKSVPGKERVLCLDEKTGDAIWKHEYDCTYEVSYPSGPRTTPVAQDGKVWTLGTMGNLLCLDAKTGDVVWAKDLRKEYDAPEQTWGFSASPLVDGAKLICLVGGKGSTVVAFHKDTGKELWRALSAPAAGYCPPVIVDGAGRRQLIVFHPQAVHGLDPETGEVYWTEKFRVNANLTVPMPRQVGDLLYLTTFYSGSALLRLNADKPGVTVLWKSKTWQGGNGKEQPDATDGLQSIIPTPIVQDGYLYGICSYGELRCIKLENDARIWETTKATTGGDKVRWANAFLIPNGDRCFLWNEKGDLIIARLSPHGYEELSRAHLLQATNTMAMQGGRTWPVIWSHPAFAQKCMFARNDKEIICVSLAAENVRGIRN